MLEVRYPIASIVVPTRNEERDIRRTLKCLTRLDYPNKEIILVDNSTDRTPKIIEEFAPHGIQMLQQVDKEGRSGARNLGILHASGEIVVILNADVHLPQDFLKRIMQHYDSGADYVLVESKVANAKSAYARYIGAEGRFEYGASDTIEWTEGFSCRRSAIIDAGLFPVGFPVPIDAGEDGYVGLQLHNKGYRKVIDRSIIVSHIAPSSLSEYWPQQIGRGKGLTQVRVLLNGGSLVHTCARLILKTAWSGLRICLVVPLVVKARRIAHHSVMGNRDHWAFTPIAFVQTLAQLVGEWASLLELLWIAIRKPPQDRRT